MYVSTTFIIHLHINESNAFNNTHTMYKAIKKIVVFLITKIQFGKI